MKVSSLKENGLKFQEKSFLTVKLRHDLSVKMKNASVCNSCREFSASLIMINLRVLFFKPFLIRRCNNLLLDGSKNV